MSESEIQVLTREWLKAQQEVAQANWAVAEAHRVIKEKQSAFDKWSDALGQHVNAETRDRYILVDGAIVHVEYANGFRPLVSRGEIEGDLSLEEAIHAEGVDMETPKAPLDGQTAKQIEAKKDGVIEAARALIARWDNGWRGGDVAPMIRLVGDRLIDLDYEAQGDALTPHQGQDGKRP